MKCEICGQDDIKNLGVHNYQKHRDKTKTLTVDSEIIKDEKLSDLLSQMRAILNRYQNELNFRVEEVGGKISTIEITARIKL